MNFFYQPDQHLNYLPIDDSSHCVRVLRKKEGDKIWITDGQGHQSESIITRADARKCQFERAKPISVNPETPAIHIAISPTKQMERMEWFVEKATEIGIHRITIIKSEHSERSKINMERLRKTAVSAMKQSMQAWLPIIDGISSIQNIIAHATEPQKFIAEQVPGAQSLEQFESANAIICLVGPEGGFSSEEIDAAKAGGFKPVLLNPHRLRTETAGLVACQILHTLSA